MRRKLNYKWKQLDGLVEVLQISFFRILTNPFQLSIATMETGNLSRRNSNDSCSDEDRLRMNGDDQEQRDPDAEAFKEKILNTKLNEDNKENSLPSQRRLLRGLSQVALPVINE